MQGNIGMVKFSFCKHFLTECREIILSWQGRKKDVEEVVHVFLIKQNGGPGSYLWLLRK